MKQKLFPLLIAFSALAVSCSAAFYSITGSLAVTGSLSATGSAFLRGLTTTAQTNILTYNPSTGQLYYTASSAIIVSGSQTTPGGSDTHIQFNSGSVFAGTGSLTFNYTLQSLQQGLNVSASGLYSHAEGNGTRATSAYSHAEGQFTTASGQYSHAEGVSTQATNTGAHAEGNGTIASAASSHAEGTNTRATQTGAHAEGENTLASNFYAHSEGRLTTASTWAARGRTPRWWTVRALG